MKGNNRVISYCILALFLSSCSQSTPATTTVTASPIPSSTATHTPEPTVAPTETPIPKLELPNWVSDPTLNILMTHGLIGEQDQIILLNTETGEIVGMDLVQDISAIFWMPDGKSIGIIADSSPDIFLVDLTSGLIEKYKPGINTFAYVSRPYDVYEPRFLYAFGSSTIDNNFTLSYYSHVSFPLMHLEVSNAKYSAFVSDEEGKNHIFYIRNTSTEATLEIEFPLASEARSTAYLLLSFAPAGNNLGVLNTDERTLVIYNASTGQPIIDYKDVTSINWSPDGNLIAYDPQPNNWSIPGNIHLYDNDVNPCILNVAEGEKLCPTEIRDRVYGVITNFQWSPDISKLAFIVFGRICYFELESKNMDCPTNIVSELDDGGINVVSFNWSPDSQYFAFNYDNSCAHCDYAKEPKGGIVSVDGSQYHIIGNIDDFFQPGIWRPIISP